MDIKAPQLRQVFTTDSFTEAKHTTTFVVHNNILFFSRNQQAHSDEQTWNHVCPNILKLFAFQTAFCLSVHFKFK